MGLYQFYYVHKGFNINTTLNINGMSSSCSAEVDAQESDAICQALTKPSTPVQVPAKAAQPKHKVLKMSIVKTEDPVLAAALVVNRDTAQLVKRMDLKMTSFLQDAYVLYAQVSKEANKPDNTHLSKLPPQLKAAMVIFEKAQFTTRDALGESIIINRDSLGYVTSSTNNMKGLLVQAEAHITGLKISSTRVNKGR